MSLHINEQSIKPLDSSYKVVIHACQIALLYLM